MHPELEISEESVSPDSGFGTVLTGSERSGSSQAGHYDCLHGAHGMCCAQPDVHPVSHLGRPLAHYLDVTHIVCVVADYRCVLAYSGFSCQDKQVSEILNFILLSLYSNLLDTSYSILVEEMLNNIVFKLSDLQFFFLVDKTCKKKTKKTFN